MSPELFYLALVSTFTAVMWIPYILNMIVGRGLADAVGYPENPKPTAAWAVRMKAAHYNAVENLVVFAALVLIANAVKDRLDVDGEISESETKLNQMQTDIDHEAIRMLTIYGPVASDLRYLLVVPVHDTDHRVRRGFDDVSGHASALVATRADGGAHGGAALGVAAAGNRADLEFLHVQFFVDDRTNFSHRFTMNDHTLA